MGTFNQELTKYKKKRGRPPKFKTAKELAKAFEDYKAFCDEHPYEIVTIFKGEESVRYVQHPYTLCGFMVFCDMGEWRDFARYTRERGDDFSTLISRIEVEVREHQVGGGMTGQYNSNLTARLNGLTDKKDVTSNGKEIDLKFEIVSGKGK